MTAYPALSNDAPIIPCNSESSRLRLNPPRDSGIFRDGVPDKEEAVRIESRTVETATTHPCLAELFKEVVLGIVFDVGDRKEVETTEAFRSNSSFSNNNGARETRDERRDSTVGPVDFGVVSLSILLLSLLLLSLL